MAQVAEEAQMKRTTVYRYFPNHEALLVELSFSVDVNKGFAAPDGVEVAQWRAERRSQFNVE